MNNHPISSYIVLLTISTSSAARLLVAVEEVAVHQVRETAARRRKRVVDVEGSMWGNNQVVYLFDIIW